jgi:hypothetical protein
MPARAAVTRVKGTMGMVKVKVKVVVVAAAAAARQWQWPMEMIPRPCRAMTNSSDELEAAFPRGCTAYL